MREYIVEVTGQYKDGRTALSQITTKAKRPQMALLQVSGFHPLALWWGENGCVEVPDEIVGLKVVNSR